MDKPVLRQFQAYRGLIAGYTEAIRASDFKANIAFLFVAFMMGSVLWNYVFSQLPAKSARAAAFPDRLLSRCSWC